MVWIDGVSHGFSGLFFANALPHLIAALMGRPMQTPFAKPPGQGLSSSFVNGVWGLVNLVVAWLLLFRVGTFDLASTSDAVAFGAGMAVITLVMARQFGRFNGGNTPGGE
jgi:hypothetical protein